MIRVTYRAGLAGMTGCASEQIEASRVRDVLAHIRKRYGKQAYLEARRQLIAVNQKSVTLMKHLNTPLPEGCTVDFLTVTGA